MIVDDRPGTTRDAVDSPVRFHGRTLVLVDTAGLRRRLDSQPAWEFYATLRALRRSIAPTWRSWCSTRREPIQKQDARIAERSCSPAPRRVIAVNKWDLPEKDDHTAGALGPASPRGDPVPGARADRVRLRPDGAAGQPASPRRSSASTTRRATRGADRGVERGAEGGAGAESALRPRGSARPRFYYATQVTTGAADGRPVRERADCVSRRPYLRYLNTAFREAFGFEGSPIRLVLRKS